MLQCNSFYIFYKLNQSILLIENTLKTFFSYFIIVKICVNFSIIRFYSSFLIFFIVSRFTIKSFFNTIAGFFPNFIIIFYHFITFYKKKSIYLVSSKSPLHTLIFGRNIYKSLIFYRLCNR